jgi:SPP1 gp7 family putative phage head morphogenesis protein
VADARLDVAARTVNEQVFDRAVRHATYLERLKTGEVKKTLEFLDQQVRPDLIKQVEIAYAKLPKGQAVTASAKRLRETLVATDATIATGYRELAKRNIETAKNLAISEADFTRAMLNDALPLDVDILAPNPNLLRAIVNARPMQGAILKDWYDGLETGAKAGVRREIMTGLAQGETIQQMSRRLRGAMDISRRNAESVVRTTVNHVTTHAKEATYEVNSDIVKKVQYIATLDDRTTIICASLDGEVFPINEGPRPPQHWRCRSTTAPVLVSASELGAELGIPMKDVPKGTRASMNGQVPAKMTYSEWLKTQSVETQNKVLGVKKATLFRKGTPIRKFVDANKRPLTLRQVEELEGIRKPKPPKKKDTLRVARRDYPALDPNAKMTWDRYRDPTTGVWHPTRQQMHNEAIDDMMKGGVAQEQPVVDWMGGGTASGKSSLVDEGYIVHPRNHVRVDADLAKSRYLQEYVDGVASGDLDAAYNTHWESSHLSLRGLQEAGRRRYNVVFDGTGDGSLEKMRARVEFLKKRGYKIRARYVDVPTDEAIRREAIRAAEGGRKVPEEVIKNTYNQLSKNLPKAIDEGLFDDLKLYNNSGPKNVPPKLILEVKDGKITLHDPEAWARFRSRDPAWRDEIGKIVWDEKDQYWKVQPNPKKKFPAFNPDGETTLAKFYDAERGIWTPERAALHDLIEEATFRNVFEQPGQSHLHMMGGGPGSGKGSVLKYGFVGKPKGAAHIDPDRVKNMMPEFNAAMKSDDWGVRKQAAPFAHDESSAIQMRLLHRAKAKNFNVLLDGTGDGSIEKLKRKVMGFKDDGYRVTASYVDVDTAEALRRVEKRFIDEGRDVPPEVVKAIYTQMPKTVKEALDTRLYDEFLLFNNDVPFGSAPIPVLEYKQIPLTKGKLAGTTVRRHKVINRELWDKFLRGNKDPYPPKAPRKKKLASKGWTWDPAKYEREQSRWLANLTPNERRAVSEFGGSFYAVTRAVNKLPQWDAIYDSLKDLSDRDLRMTIATRMATGDLPSRAKTRLGDIGFNEYGYEAAVHIRKAIERAPRDRSSVMHRGLKRWEKRIYKVGEPIKLEADSSFSTSREIAMGFTGGDYPLMYTVRKGKHAGGADISRLTGIASEKERLFHQAREFRVVRVDWDTRYGRTLQMLTLEEIGDGGTMIDDVMPKKPAPIEVKPNKAIVSLSKSKAVDAPSKGYYDFFDYTTPQKQMTQKLLEDFGFDTFLGEKGASKNWVNQKKNIGFETAQNAQVAHALGKLDDFFKAGGDDMKKFYKSLSDDVKPKPKVPKWMRDASKPQTYDGEVWAPSPKGAMANKTSYDLSMLDTLDREILADVLHAVHPDVSLDLIDDWAQKSYMSGKQFVTPNNMNTTMNTFSDWVGNGKPYAGQGVEGFFKWVEEAY